jgi:hypothetical protein
MTMNSRILLRASPLQQQPQRRVNQQQQQSSGSVEFQPGRARQAGQGSSATGQGRQTGLAPTQRM